MADVSFHASTVDMRKQARRISSIVDGLRTDFSCVKEQMSDSDSYWTGISGRANRSLMLQMEDMAEKIFDRLQNYPDNLFEMAGEYEKMESESLTLVNMLSGNVLR